MIFALVSGGFDPVHVGHLRMFKDAKKMADKVVVLLNNDEWLIKKKYTESEAENTVGNIKYTSDFDSIFKRRSGN